MRNLTRHLEGAWRLLHPFPCYDMMTYIMTSGLLDLAPSGPNRAHHDQKLFREFPVAMAKSELRELGWEAKATKDSIRSRFLLDFELCFGGHTCRLGEVFSPTLSANKRIKTFANLLAAIYAPD